MHMPRFWKHKETKEVIDHATYSDLKAERSDFDECDVTGEVLTGDKIATVTIDGVPEPVEITNGVTLPEPIADAETTVVEVND
jgi:hypothetical protein